MTNPSGGKLAVMEMIVGRSDGLIHPKFVPTFASFLPLQNYCPTREPPLDFGTTSEEDPRTVLVVESDREHAFKITPLSSSAASGWSKYGP